jgi:hypothetical protein
MNGTGTNKRTAKFNIKENERQGKLLAKFVPEE